MFTKDTSPGARAVQVQCLACGGRRTMSDMVIDTEGPSFLAYYCDVPGCTGLAPYLKQTRDEWVIDGVEFIASRAVAPAGCPPVLVRQYVLTERGDGARTTFFVEAELEEAGLDQLVDDGYLVREFFGEHAPGRFVLRLNLDDDGKFPDGSEPQDCHICERYFAFTDDGSQLLMTHPGSGPSFSCGGTPPDYEPACQSCMEPEEQDEEPDEEDLWRDRGLI